MRKAIVVLALIAFACDFSRDVLVHGDPARKPEAAGRNDDYEYQKEPRDQYDDDAEAPRRSAEDRERADEPVGRWRSNGEALEPKWRDGDSVPLRPFSHYRSYSRDEVDDADPEDFPDRETSRRPYKYRYSNNRPYRRRRGPGRRLPPADDYDYAYSRGRDYDDRRDDRDRDYPRRRRRPVKNPPSLTLYDEEMVESASNDGTRGDLTGTLNDEVTFRYREAFQAHPDEYEHEFNDEEYLRPRPRKRRPPQNYEFALANEASSADKENEEPSRDPSPSRPTVDEDPPATTQSSDNERENVLELKSLLKMQQREGSSLSEILQRQNLTLNDLLKGKADVINALKSRVTEESDEYIEEMSRVMSNSLMKLAATVTPPWRFAPTSTTPGSASTKIAASSTSPGTLSTIVLDEASYDTNGVKEESENVEGVTQSTHDSPRLRATTPPIVSTVITTSTSPPVVISSMEYLLNDDGNAELTSDRATKLVGALDEDEIMEFSDFTDFKKGKSPAAPTWSADETIGPQPPPRDIESTLSIERILNPTERIELTKDRESDAESNSKKVIRNNGQSVPTESSAQDYGTFIEAEYQNDAPIDVPKDDGKQAAANDFSGDATKNRAVANSADDKRESLHDKNHSAEYHQVDRGRTRDRVLQNHDANSRHYEDAVSELEPEARAEIFELFASGSAGRRLERLLKSRNMSVEELIALRQRGSSKVHLTEVSRLKVPKNPPILETSHTNNGEIIIPLFRDSDEHFESKKILEKEDTKQGGSSSQFKDIMSYLHDPFLDKDAENMSMSRLLDLVERDRNASGDTISDNDTSNVNKHSERENSHRTIVDLLATFDSLPFAKDVQRQFEADSGESKAKLPVDNDNARVVLIDEEKQIVRPDNTSSEFHAGYVEEIAREEPNTIEIRTIYDETVNGANGGDERKTLSKVRPSIIASGAILGVTIIVFLAIFIVCRIRQKQRYTYRNTFSRAVFQGPVMTARKLSNSSSLSTVMVNVVATSTAKRPDRTEAVDEFDAKCDMDNDSLDANDSWETIPDYAK